MIITTIAVKRDEIRQNILNWLNKPRNHQLIKANSARGLFASFKNVMAILESKPYTNWISIIRGPGLAGTNDFKKDGMIVVKKIRPEWLNTELINILRWEDDGGKIIGPDRSTRVQKRTKPHE